MSSIDQVQFKAAEDISKMATDYLSVFSQLQSFMSILQSKLQLFGDDKSKIEVLLSDYHSCFEKLRELDMDIRGFSSLESDEKRMLFLMAGHDLAFAKQFVMELPLKLVDTEHGRSMVDQLGL